MSFTKELQNRESKSSLKSFKAYAKAFINNFKSSNRISMDFRMLTFVESKVLFLLSFLSFPGLNTTTRGRNFYSSSS